MKIMNITKEQIESVKDGNDIVSVIKSKGIPLKKKGKNYIGLCPFHSEKTPSFTVDPEKQLYHCFGCKNSGKGSTGGDVIGFIVKHDKITFPEAVKKLSNDLETEGAVVRVQRAERAKKQKSAASSQDSEEKISSSPNPAKIQKLLNRVVEFYHKTFTQDEQGLKYLSETRKITDKNIFTAFKIGYSNGTLLKTLPKEGELIAELKEIGILNHKGNELFYGSVTFPIYDEQGNITTIYGRKITDQENNHLYLPGERKGVFNWQTVKINEEIILTESLIDSLTLYNAGLKNTIPCYGTNGLTEGHLDLFRRYNVKTVYLCLNGDDPGKEAAQAMLPKLSDISKVYPVTLPDNHDINSFFVGANPCGCPSLDTFKTFLTNANPELTQPIKEKESVKEKKDIYNKTEQGFTVTYGDREYEIIGISKSPTKLKATVKGIKTEKGKRRFHVDTVDFYSSRSRFLLISGLKDLFGEGEGVITEDINKILEQIEKQIETSDQEKTDTPKQEMTQEEKEAGLNLLKNPEMFKEIVEDIETLGYTGDNINKLLCYIAAVSRKMEEPLSIMIQSRSAAGKSFLQDTILSMLPEEDYVKYTRLTDQSLFYKDRYSLANKILAIEEFDGMNGALYSIRAMQSSKKITIAYTGKDGLTGTMKTEENTVEGPVMIFITTTAVEIDGETASRFLFISLDESKEMTEKILKKQREKHTIQGLMAKLDAQKIIKKHKAVNRLLRPLYVINPYSNLLTFASQSLRARRDHMKYLNLILAIAYLFQYQREIKRLVPASSKQGMKHNGKEIEYITVKIGDIEKANKIAGEVIGMSLEELTPPSKRLLLLIQEMVKKICEEKKISSKDYRFSRRDIRQYTGWSDFQVKTHIKELEEMEYLYSIAGKKGKEYVYELVYTDGEPHKLLGQIDIEELKQKARQAGIPVE